MYGLMCACVEMDLWQELDEVKPGTAPGESAPPPAKRQKHSFAASKRGAYALKKSAGNPICHAYLIHADQENLMKMWTIHRMALPLRSWHQKWNVELGQWRHARSG